MKLESERLIIREWYESDANNYLEIYSSLEVKDAGADICNNIDECKDIIHTLINLPDAWAIVLKENKKVIGSIFLSDTNRHDRYRELEYIILNEYQNKGFATEAVNQVLKYAFTELNLLIVAVCHYPNNLKSKRVIEKCGFLYEGTLRKYSRNLMDSVRYSITKDEWEQHNKIDTY